MNDIKLELNTSRIMGAVYSTGFLILTVIFLFKFGTQSFGFLVSMLALCWLFYQSVRHHMAIKDSIARLESSTGLFDGFKIEND